MYVDLYNLVCLVAGICTQYKHACAELRRCIDNTKTPRLSLKNFLKVSYSSEKFTEMFFWKVR